MDQYALTFYTADQVAELLQLHKRTVTRLIREGEIRAVRLGGRIRISSAELHRIADSAQPRSPSEQT